MRQLIEDCLLSMETEAGFNSEPLKRGQRLLFFRLFLNTYIDGDMLNHPFVDLMGKTTDVIQLNFDKYLEQWQCDTNKLSGDKPCS